MSLEKLIAFLFQTTGKDRLTEKEIYMILSFKLGWLTPAEGKKAIQKALEKNLIKKEGDEIIPNFDYRSIDIPFEFKFDAKMLEMEEDLYSKIVARVVKSKNIGEKKVREEIEELAEKNDIYKEVAALVIAKRYGLDIDDLIDEAWKMVKK
ncbi:MAG: DUF2240 family protein [Thermoplasmata archaeon]|jgi:hypothetical protein|nr:MAG: DUF2240 family protein [Thermoplasmata archaeon]